MATEWAPVEVAAGVLGLSPRTLKRRVAAGAVASKLENGRRLIAVPNGTVGPRNGTESKGQQGQNRGTATESERKNGPIVTGPQGQMAQGQAGTTGPNGTGPDIALLLDQRDRDRAEIAFLRATVEQHQRSEAELRASLREALRVMPKQLTDGAAQNGAELTPKRAEVVLPAEREKGPKIAAELPQASDIDLDEINDLIFKAFGR